MLIFIKIKASEIAVQKKYWAKESLKEKGN
jgi:hypothetical protein